jgi:hypothetical protein
MCRELTFHAVPTFLIWARKETSTLTWTIDIENFNGRIKSTVKPSIMVNYTALFSDREKDILVCSKIERKAMGCDLTFAVIDNLVRCSQLLCQCYES